jgi:hypothetical protein
VPLTQLVGHAKVPGQPYKPCRTTS